MQFSFGTCPSFAVRAALRTDEGAELFASWYQCPELKETLTEIYDISMSSGERAVFPTCGTEEEKDKNGIRATIEHIY